MKQRAMVLILACGCCVAAGGPAPTDVERMNRFARHYNLYCEHLRAGVVDMKEWERVERAWRAIHE